jgi:hypothetical protein
MEQSQTDILRTGISVKKWIENPPSVNASREPGRSLGLHGHGTRTRQLRGPTSPDGKPKEFEIRLRRYQCQRCFATMTVGPAGLLLRLLFMAPAIALALFLLATGATYPAVRRKVSLWEIVGPTAHVRWTSRIRWARRAARGELWSWAAALSSMALCSLPAVDAVMRWS